MWAAHLPGKVPWAVVQDERKWGMPRPIKNASGGTNAVRYRCKVYRPWTRCFSKFFYKEAWRQDKLLPYRAS